MFRRTFELVSRGAYIQVFTVDRLLLIDTTKVQKTENQ